MSKHMVICLALGLGLVPYARAAATYDGSIPLICALIEVMDCAPGPSVSVALPTVSISRNSSSSTSPRRR